MSEGDEKIQRALIELDKGNNKKAFSLFKTVFEDRQERLVKKVYDNPTSPTLMLDALYMLHALVLLRVAEAGKEKIHSIELIGKAVGSVETARAALGPLITGMAMWAKEEDIKVVQSKALGLLAATKDLEILTRSALEGNRRLGYKPKSFEDERLPHMVWGNYVFDRGNDRQALSYSEDEYEEDEEI